jgi:hypothetical protein
MGRGVGGCLGGWEVGGDEVGGEEDGAKGWVLSGAEFVVVADGAGVLEFGGEGDGGGRGEGSLVPVYIGGGVGGEREVVGIDVVVP